MNHWQRREAANVNEATGIWVSVAGYEGWEFQVGRDCAWNAQFQRALVRVAQQPKYKRLIERMSATDYEANDADLALDQEYTRRAWVEGLLMGWKGVTDRKGKAFASSVDNACKLFEAFPDIFTALQRAARDGSRFSIVPKSEIEALASGN